MGDNVTLSNQQSTDGGQLSKPALVSDKKPSKGFETGCSSKIQEPKEDAYNNEATCGRSKSKSVGKQPNRRTPRSGGVSSQQSSSRFEYRRFRRPPNAANRAPVVDTVNEENNPVTSEGISAVTEATKDEPEERDIHGNGNAPDAPVTADLMGMGKQDSKTPKRRICKYFTSEQSCYFGDRCRFLHVQAKKPEHEGSAPGLELSASPNSRHLRHVPFRPQIVQLTKEQVGSPEQLRAFNSEITYFMRRFPGTVVRKSENGTAIVFEYSITDPEWVFDVRSVRFSFELPQNYPVEKGCVSVADNSLPKPLIIHITKAVSEYLTARWETFNSKNAFECTGKSLIRWIDRSIFDLFVAGLKKTKMIFEAESAGISLVLPPASSDIIKTSAILTETDDNSYESVRDLRGAGVEIESEERKNDEKMAAVEDTKLQIEGNQCANIGVMEKFQNKTIVADVVTQTLSEATTPIDVRVQWKDLCANIASLSAASLALSTKCAKCEAPSFMTCMPNRIIAATCLRCSNRQSVYMKSELMHENSNIIARLDPKGCRPVDCVVLSSSFRFVCLNCGRESTAENLGYGVAHKTWCFSCHKKCEFVISAIRFIGNYHLIAKEDESMPKIKVMKKKKPEQQIVIVEGEPLPGRGTCKHYKKSYRWLRFPCCGKLYACDVCHNENERDHEMKFATRMVCGICSKEQPFQKAKPCIRCCENLTRVKSSHWEGGKGCRDQNLMSRNDDRKYANSRMKTVSKKHVGNLVVKKKSVKEE